MKFTDEDIIRYIDRALAPDRLAQFERALESDDSLNQRVQGIRDGDRALRRFASLADRLPVPELKLDSSVVPVRRRPSGVAWPLAVAASFLAAVIGFTAGMYVTPQSAVGEVAMGATPFGSILHDALESQPQGVTVSWSDAATRSTGETTVTRTWKLQDGTWCREYEFASKLDGRHEFVETGAACRDEQGNWTARMRLFPEGDRILRSNNSPAI